MYTCGACTLLIIVSNKALTDLVTSYIKNYPFDNFMRTAISLEGYKHTYEAKLKMLKRWCFARE